MKSMANPRRPHLRSRAALPQAVRHRPPPWAGCADLLAEYHALAGLCQTLSPQQWHTATDFHGWTPWDEVAHLLFFDEAALLALEDGAAFEADKAALTERLGRGKPSAPSPGSAMERSTARPSSPAGGSATERWGPRWPPWMPGRGYPGTGPR